MNRAHGIDISSWESYYKRAEKPPRPVDFAIIRTSYGMMTDSKLKEMEPAVLQAPVRGAYHYVSSAAPWKDQADLFLRLMAGKYDFWAWDVEKSYNGQSIINNVVTAMEYLLQQTGKPGLLYTNPDMWGTWFAPIQKDLLKYELWVAHYWWIPNPEGTPNYFKVNGASTMRRDWRIWQYDPNGQGGRGREYGVGSAGLDLNVYNGSLEDMMKWLHPLPLPPLECPNCGYPLDRKHWSYTP